MSTFPLRQPVTEDDSSLASRAADGDRRAFRTLYDRHLARVRAQVGRLLGPSGRGADGRPSADVDDVVQDVFVQLYRAVGTYRGDSAFTTWLYRLTWNVTVSHLRRRKTFVDLDALLPLQLSHDEWKRLEARDLMGVLYAALDEVSADARSAFVMFYVEGMTLQEIADLTGAPLNTIAARVRRSRERVASVLSAAAQPANPQAQIQSGGRS
ncbi:MAG: RNA polymerase sigma factor [Myxococcales bacterium]|nr:RNA polymerase sigma factor [Myxococcales bacterium]MCB9521726.1 RNA polymerase sigma factor [Myxococcales bacterium]MCB9532607.1 RNA polymerase sigma factor [Myxococcales bacterium]MCB9534581.1 RNA polymerase sigma factor [Myxococcales bacterium]